jgi:hypothetical protein
VTLTATYLFSVTQAMAQRRIFGTKILVLGGTPGRLLQHRFHTLENLMDDILALAQAIKSFPMLVGFDEPDSTLACALRIASLDETLTMMIYGERAECKRFRKDRASEQPQFNPLNKKIAGSPLRNALTMIMYVRFHSVKQKTHPYYIVIIWSEAKLI